MPASKVLSSAENVGTGLYHLSLYSGAGMPTKASFAGQVKFDLKNKIERQMRLSLFRTGISLTLY